jgi:hypothetical protein
MKFHKNAGDVSNAQNKIQFYPILLINFIGTLGFSIVLPFLVFLVKYLKQHNKTRTEAYQCDSSSRSSRSNNNNDDIEIL